MTVAFDTNVILDAAMGRNDYESAQALVQAVLSEDVTGVVTANTITDIHYIIKKRGRGQGGEGGSPEHPGHLRDRSGRR